MGDLNSDAEGGPGDPSWTPTYGTLVDAGFQDTWELDHPGVPFDGLTCCQADLVNNDVSTLYQRIDFILIRARDHQGSSNRLPGSIHVEIVGEEQADRTEASGFWPADHAGCNDDELCVTFCGFWILSRTRRCGVQEVNAPALVD